MPNSRKSKGISLKEVSRLAGVTQCTASRILNKNPNYSYSKATQERVVKIAEENGYRKSQLYKSLFTGKTNSAGVIIPVGEFYGKIVEGIHDELLKHNYALVMGLNQNDYDNPNNSIEKKIIHRLNEHRVDGFIMRPTFDNATDEHFKEIIDMQIPLVVVDREVSSTYASYAGSDDFKGGRLAASHFIKLGHTKIIQFSGNPLHSAFRNRAQGFEDELIKNGVFPQTVNANISKEKIFERCMIIFSQKDHPTAIFCGNDLIAQIVYEALEELRVSVPNEVSIIGFGNVTLSNCLRPKLTSIDQQPYRIGVNAAKLFLERVDDNDTIDRNPKREYSEVLLIERESCKKL